MEQQEELPQTQSVLNRHGYLSESKFWTQATCSRPFKEQTPSGRMQRPTYPNQLLDSLPVQQASELKLSGF